MITTLNYLQNFKILRILTKWAKFFWPFYNLHYTIVRYIDLPLIMPFTLLWNMWDICKY
jgi:hypothetical protein